MIAKPISGFAVLGISSEYKRGMGISTVFPKMNYILTVAAAALNPENARTNQLTCTV